MRKCNVCGQAYEPKESECLCPECHRLKKLQQSREHRIRYTMKRIHEQSHLAETERAARAAGMSYGQYQAYRRMNA